MTQIDFCEGCSQISDVREGGTRPDHWRDPGPKRIRDVLVADGIFDPDEEFDGNWRALASAAAMQAFDDSGEVAKLWGVRVSAPAEIGTCPYCDGALSSIAVYVVPAEDADRLTDLECHDCGFQPTDADDWDEQFEHIGDHSIDDVLGLEDVETVRRNLRCPDCETRVWHEYGAAEEIEQAAGGRDD